MRIGIVGPSTPILPDDAEAVRALASLGYSDIELEFDPQCFATHGHFAGEDGHRFAALVAKDGPGIFFVEPHHSTAAAWVQDVDRFLVHSFSLLAASAAR